LAAAKSFQNTSSFYTALNPAYSEVGEQRIWGQAIFAVAQGNLSPEQAADIAINQIKNIFTQWK
jgi:multiple sugar transport system substrate-binding protein